MERLLKTSVLLIAAISFGCASPVSEQASLIKDADEKMVTECSYLGDVQGSSGVGGMMASQGMTNSKNEAKEQAVKLKATHVLWKDISGGYSPSASGRAYDCVSKTDHKQT